LDFHLSKSTSEYRKQYYTEHPEAYEAQKRRARLWQYEHRYQLRMKRKEAKKKMRVDWNIATDNTNGEYGMTRYCPQCGIPKQPQWLFCPECGAKFFATRNTGIFLS
jgi:hypothetical protein